MIGRLADRIALLPPLAFAAIVLAQCMALPAFGIALILALGSPA